MISSYLELLVKRFKGSLGQQGQEYVDFVLDGTARMRELIDALLTYSRVGTRGSDFKAVEIEQVIEQTCKDLGLSIAESKAQITWDGQPPIVHGDATQIRQLFQNLIDNAIKYRGSEALRIKLHARERSDSWEFAVADNGIGIDSRFAERVFAIFQRLHTRREYKGTGIGLAICKRIVERHAGRIWVTSQVGKGSTFYFTLPKCEQSTSLEAEQRAASG
ncbi:MAG: hypothetical protein DCC75_11310 [Proteobacteria bacterium]|nr:MAG: hypothetical protein DCC75_11310 [Pseudomonadota bacterium]